MYSFTSPLAIIKGSIYYTDNYEQIVRSQIMDALTTNQGERVMHPDWGCNIQSMLYDPSSALERQDTAAYIRDRLIHMVPRALITGVSVRTDLSDHSVVYIDVQYKSSSYPPSSNVTVGMSTTSTSSGAAAA